MAAYHIKMKPAVEVSTTRGGGYQGECEDSINMYHNYI
jgi:hypothetical protein